MVSGGTYHVQTAFEQNGVPPVTASTTNGVPSNAPNGIHASTPNGTASSTGTGFKLGTFCIDEDRPMKVVVIGAGFSGIVAGIRCVAISRLLARRLLILYLFSR